jgi:hypothetical protein
MALLNTGERMDADVFRIKLFNGETRHQDQYLRDAVTCAWKQIGTILAQHAPGTTQGYAHITRIAGNNPFIAYAVINDGAEPGERTGDGAFVASSP